MPTEPFTKSELLILAESLISARLRIEERNVKSTSLSHEEMTEIMDTLEAKLRSLAWEMPDDDE